MFKFLKNCLKWGPILCMHHAQVTEEQECSPQVFLSAVQYLDRVLACLPIKRFVSSCELVSVTIFLAKLQSSTSYCHSSGPSCNCWPQLASCWRPSSTTLDRCPCSTLSSSPTAPSPSLSCSPWRCSSWKSSGTFKSNSKTSKAVKTLARSCP